jgi:hypothetical protein
MALQLPFIKNAEDFNDDKEGSVKDSTIAPDDSMHGSEAADSEVEEFSSDYTEQDLFETDSSINLRQRCVGTKLAQPQSPKELVTTWASSSSASAGDQAHNGGSSECAERISISSTSILACVCRRAPAIFLFGSMAIFTVTAVVWPDVFFGLLSLLTVQVYGWIAAVAIFGLVGVHKMRSALATDWEDRWETFERENPEEAKACKHILILPLCKEDESTLCDTLRNLARFTHAQEQMHVVLAMEGCEDSHGYHKAERLIAAHKHCFANMFATFHPGNIPGETAGKSANCQWAFRQVQHEYKTKFGAFADKVFLTIGDADSLWHPQYFLALALDGLAMNREDRSWSLWQSPTLRLHNHSTVPGPMLMSSYAKSCFEMAGLAGQEYLGPHMTSSAYSLTLALATHSLVNGWDTDVIAEDHHMFCKCLFASIRSCSSAGNKLAPKVKLNPIYLPVMSCMAESSNGWLDYCNSCFQQAHRHSQGVAELAYSLFQYCSLISTVGFTGLTAKSHYVVLCIIWKMSTVHLLSALRAFGMMLASQFAVIKVMDMHYRGEFWTWYSVTLSQMLEEGPSSFQGSAFWSLAIIFAALVPLSMMMACTSYQIVKHSREGRCLPLPDSEKDAAPPEAPLEIPMVLSELYNTVLVAWSYVAFGETMILTHSLIPEVVACLSLAGFGTAKQG